MATTVNVSEPLRASTPTDPTPTRLRTVTGNRFPRKCAGGCGLPIPRDPEIRHVVDFGATKPYPAYLREHSPDYGTYGASRPRKTTESVDAVPAFPPASELIRESPTPRVPRSTLPTRTRTRPRPPRRAAHGRAGSLSSTRGSSRARGAASRTTRGTARARSSFAPA